MLTTTPKALATRDRLLEDDFRRRQGAFYTPELWVAEAHKEISTHLGPNWREECLVWDSAAGTANLSRAYSWGDLVSSTIEGGDVEVTQEHGWGGRVFRYDFLNPGPLPPDVDEKLRAAAKSGKTSGVVHQPTLWDGSEHRDVQVI